MTLEMKLAEERKEGYAEGFDEGQSAGYSMGAAEQRVRDEAQLKAQEDEIQRLKSVIENLTKPI